MPPGPSGGSIFCLVAAGVSFILSPSVMLADESFTLSGGMTATSVEHSGYLGSTSTMVRVFIFDSGTAWLPDFINLGYVNPDARLTITNFGAVSTPGEILIGNTSSPFFKSTNNGLVIKSGGQLNVASGTIGYGASSSNTVLVADDPSLWSINAMPGLTLGMGSGANNSLTISNGGRVMNLFDASIVGNYNQVLITGSTSGPPSMWHNMGNLSVGGTKSQVTVADGAHLDNMNGTIAGTGSTSNSVTVTGMGSLWGNAGSLIMGPGSYGQLTISNRGMAGSMNGYVDGFNNHATVTGTGSVWTVQQNLYLAYAPFSLGGELVVTNGGIVFNRDGYVGFTYAPVGNNALVTGPGSMWRNNGDLYVGYASALNQLAITAGGNVSSRNGYIGYSNVVIGPTPKVKDNRVLVDGAGAAWTNSEFVFVGHGGFSSQLVATNGGLIVTSNGVLGLMISSSNNLAVVTGTNVISGPSRWINQADLVIGGQGAGNQLLVLDGGGLENGGRGILGAAMSSSNNSAVIAGSLTYWTNYSKSNLYVGDGGAGNRLTISNSARVLFSGDGFVGNQVTSSNNLILVTDPSSFFTVKETQLHVGFNGSNNRLIVSNQAHVEIGEGSAHGASHLSIGDQDNVSSNNTVIISGNGSLLGPGHQVDDLRVHVGKDGRRNSLLVTDYGLLVSNKGFVGDGTNATENVAVVADHGQWRLQFMGSGTGLPAFHVGSQGAQNLLLITNAGVVTVKSNSAIIGVGVTSTNNTVIVTGTDSLWDIELYLFVGNDGSSNQLLISNGGEVRDTNGFIGNNLSSSNNLVRVAGPSSRWINSSAVRVGEYGANNKLIVSQGARVESLNGFVGAHASASNNSALVANAPSRWMIQSNLYVGNEGSFNSLTISNGGVVDDFNGHIGYMMSARSNAVVVTDLGSIWSHTGALFVGSTGSCNSMTIKNGGLVTDDIAFIGTYSEANGNYARVTDLGSIWNNASVLTVGDEGSSNQLTVANAGLVTCPALEIGFDTASSNNAVIVTGSQSLLDISQFISVGFFGSSNQLVVSDQGRINTVTTSVGDFAPSSSNQLVITGEGALYDNTTDVSVGNRGWFNRLLIRDGGELRNDEGRIGFQAGSSNNVALVTGVGALWRNTNELEIGFSGASNQLIIAAGGVVTSEKGFLGVNPFADDNLALVTDVDSVWNVRSNLYVGNFGARCQLRIEDGGTVNDSEGFIGFLFGSDDDSAVISGSGSRWNNSGNVYVGNGGAHNQLTISGGGRVSSTEGFIGYGSASSGNSALVTGPGSRWSVSGGLYVGYSGSSNHLTIANGGVVTVPQSAIIGLASANNFATLAVGTFNVVDAASHNAVLIVQRGGFFLVNGALVTDRLVLTNGANCFFNFGGGRIDTRQTTVSNTAPFIVGNGTNTATLNFLGGVHSFADGLQISSNAFLTGTGTNFGNVSSAGTVNPGGSNGLGVLNVQGNYNQTIAGTLQVDLGGATAGAGFDQLNISGAATLSGTLNVTFTNGFNPGPGSAFRVMTFGSHVSEFTTITGLTAPNGLTLVPRYSATDLILVETNAPLRLESVRRVGTNLFFDIPTISGFSYLVEDTGSLNPPDWHVLQTIPGDGTLHTVQVPIASTGERYFRIRFE